MSGASGDGSRAARTAMGLQDFFAAIAPFLQGRETHAQAAARLYGPVLNDLDTDDSGKSDSNSGESSAAARDAARLELYGRFCRVHRLDALGSTFAETRAAFAQRSGPAAWEALVDEYFRAHPMHHAELNENGSELPAFLRARAETRAAGSAGAEGGAGAADAMGTRREPRALEAWLAELADLEWWSFRTRVAPDDERDAQPEQGALRLASTVELRPYAHDLCGWLEPAPDGDPAEARGGEPEARACVVIFWRDLDLDTRFAEASPLELLVLQAVHLGQPAAALDEAAARAGATGGELAETLADLRAAGILLGPLP